MVKRLPFLVSQVPGFFIIKEQRRLPQPGSDQNRVASLTSSSFLSPTASILTQLPPVSNRLRLMVGTRCRASLKLLFLWITRRHLINSRRWRGQRFGPATRREEGASPQWGCDRRTTKWPAQRSAAPVIFLLFLSFISFGFSLIHTPLRVFMRWLLDSVPPETSPEPCPARTAD